MLKKKLITLFFIASCAMNLPVHADDTITPTEATIGAYYSANDVLKTLTTIQSYNMRLKVS